MHAMVTARVPSEIRDQVNEKLRAIGSSPTELINAAYDYVLTTGELPDAQQNDVPLRITLTPEQTEELRFRLNHATKRAPDSFWKTHHLFRTERGA